MAWRIIRQPNGKLARFSDVVDNFTHYDMTVNETFTLCFEHMGRKDAEEKVRAGVEDHKPWTNGIKGDGLSRWRDAIESIRDVHGDEEADRIVKLLGGTT